MSQGNFCEVIKCKYRQIIAACVIDSIDKDWLKSKAKYKKKGGYTFEVLRSTEFRFGKCECKKVEDIQLQIFENPAL